MNFIVKFDQKYKVTLLLLYSRLVPFQRVYMRPVRQCKNYKNKCQT